MDYALSMMNDMMPTVEEMLTPDMVAEMEYKQEQQQEELWSNITGVYGYTLSQGEWSEYVSERNRYFDTI